MSVTAQLADGRTLEFPDGTDPSVVQTTVKKMLGVDTPPMGAVAINAANKGLAGLPDAVLNTPTNIINLVKAGVGTVAGMAGRPDLMPDVSEPPNYAQRAMKAMGFVNDANNPQTPTQRVVDSMVQGGVGMAVNPANSVKQAVGNVITGVVGGGAGGVTKEATGSEPLAITASMATPFAARAMAQNAAEQVTNALTRKSANEVRDQTLSDARDAGYVMPPSVTNPDGVKGFVNKRLESIAGKAAVKQESAGRNQTVTNELAVDELGLPKGTALTEGKLNAFRDTVSAPYREVAAISPQAATALENLKDARFQANAYNKFFDRSADPDALRQAKQFGATAEALENQLEQMAAQAGKPDLIPELRDARKQIAKSYDVERALNVGDASVSAPTIGRAVDKNSGITGNLQTIGKFAEAFSPYVTEGAKVPSPGVSKLEAVASALLAGSTGAGALMGGHGGVPAVLAATGAALVPPLASGAARSLVLSKPYQNFMGKPGYDVSLINKVLSELPPGSSQDAALQSLLLGRAVAERNKGAQ